MSEFSGMDVGEKNAFSSCNRIFFRLVDTIISKLKLPKLRQAICFWD